MLDLDAIRRRWAATPWTNGRTPELADDIAAMFSELDRLRSELAAFTRPYLILDDPEGIIGCVEATSREAAWEAFKAANPNDYSGDPDDNDVVIRRITAELYDGVVDALEIARSELAAAQAAPVVEWRRIRDFDEAQMGDLILTVHSDGWTIRAVDIAVDELATLADGDEGGPAGKAACEAAYRRACGLPAIPACAG